MYAAQLEPKPEPPKYPELPDSSRVTASDIPSGHPTFLANIWYDALVERTEPEKLPQLEAYLYGLDDFTSQYAMVLRPIEIDAGVDFEILARGPHFPGRDAPQCRSEKCYTDGLAPELAQARLFELLSCLALGRSFLSTGVAGRPGMLGVKVHRGLFPLWSRELNCRAIVMIVAPIYIAQASEVVATIVQDDICAEAETSLPETAHQELEADAAGEGLEQISEAADKPSMEEGSLEPEASLAEVTPEASRQVAQLQGDASGSMQDEPELTNEALAEAETPDATGAQAEQSLMAHSEKEQVAEHHSEDGLAAEGEAETETETAAASEIDAIEEPASEAETDSNVEEAEAVEESKSSELADASS